MGDYLVLFFKMARYSLYYFILTLCMVQKHLKVGRDFHCIEKVFDAWVQDFIYMWIDQESALFLSIWHSPPFLCIFFLPYFYSYLIEELISEENLFVEKRSRTHVIKNLKWYWIDWSGLCQGTWILTQHWPSQLTLTLGKPVPL